MSNTVSMLERPSAPPSGYVCIVRKDGVVRARRLQTAEQVDAFVREQLDLGASVVSVEADQ